MCLKGNSHHRCRRLSKKTYWSGRGTPLCGRLRSQCPRLPGRRLRSIGDCPWTNRSSTLHPHNSRYCPTGWWTYPRSGSHRRHRGGPDGNPSGTSGPYPTSQCNGSGCPTSFPTCESRNNWCRTPPWSRTTQSCHPPGTSGSSSHDGPFSRTPGRRCRRRGGRGQPGRGGRRPTSHPSTFPGSRSSRSRRSQTRHYNRRTSETTSYSVPTSRGGDGGGGGGQRPLGSYSRRSFRSRCDPRPTNPRPKSTNGLRRTCTSTSGPFHPSFLDSNRSPMRIRCRRRFLRLHCPVGASSFL